MCKQFCSHNHWKRQGVGVGQSQPCSQGSLLPIQQVGERTWERGWGKVGTSQWKGNGVGEREEKMLAYKHCENEKHSLIFIGDDGYCSNFWKMTCRSLNCQMLPAEKVWKINIVNLMAGVVNVTFLARFYELLCGAIKFGPYKDFNVSCYLLIVGTWNAIFAGIVFLMKETLLASLKNITLLMMTSHKAFLIRI